ncbi:hypothetical protein [Amycolatopsis sp. La24]|uniref:hypothetical protein n=1 Tax=Amycolatopsis sp. La24 TaxID=3028304 RepID=UPI0023B1B083|nr:hypothetical protein [Amycolatopsis sp. La24]
MLRYRLFVEVNDARRDVEKKASEQLHSWLREKNLDADALREGTEVALADHATGSLDHSVRADGSRSLRSVIKEHNSGGHWRTQLTIDVPGHARSKPWLWLDLDGPGHIEAGIPRLARSLLEVFDANAGGVRHGEAQPIWDADEIADLVDAVRDPSRRTLVFVAGSDPRLPFGQWLDHVRNLLRDCVGLAGGYVLSPDATAAFNKAVGEGHRVDPWCVRTFRPGVLLDDSEDGRRHRVLGMDRIVADPVHRLARMLGRRAREAALETPLPTAAVRVDRIFAQIINASLIAPLDKLPDEVPAARVDETVQRHIDPVAGVLSQILGGDVTVERVLELGNLAEAARAAHASRSAIEARLSGYEAELESVRQAHQELRKQLEDTQFDFADVEEERAAAQTEARRLQRLLSRVAKPDDIWTTPAVVTERRPQDYEELVDLIMGSELVQFTGNYETVRDLDRYDTGAWAGKIWDVFGTLDDYVQAITDGSFSGSVQHYLAHTPPGCRTFSIARHAADESDAVKSTDKLRRERIFPVPCAVDASERIFMGAHFKIAQFGQISPRLHYYNDVHRTGKVYVGYIGPHLRNLQTN